MQVLTVTPKGNLIKVDLIRKGCKRITDDIFSDNQFGVKFDSIDSDLMAIIKDTVAQVRKKHQPIKIDLEAGTTELLQNKSFAPTKSVVEERNEWERKQRIGTPITKAQQWDNMHNEGGEGYNPYRY